MKNGKRSLDYLNGTEAVSAQQMAQSFKSKSDFKNYFDQCLQVSEVCSFFVTFDFYQLYTPPISQFDKEWIRMVLGGEKKLCPLSELKPVAIGHYPEVSVKTLFPMYCDRAEVRDYLPSKMCKGRSLDKTYFFNILNTFVHDELQAILSHAHSQRNSIADQQQRSEAIMLSEKMAEDLFKYPWISVSELLPLLTKLFLEITR